MSKFRVVFFGTPDIALTSLQILFKDEHFSVAAIVTQPDRPAGRNLQLTPTPVKRWVEAHLAQPDLSSIPVLVPENINKDQGVLDTLRSLNADIGIVVAYGQILSQKLLDMFPFGCVNIHASLLPLWRGAAPIQRAIMAGDSVTGVSLQKIVKKLDAGDVLGERRVLIDANEDALELQNRLAAIAPSLLQLELLDYLRGNLLGTPQDESRVTIATKIDKSESRVSFAAPAETLHNHVRGLQMGPGAFVEFKGKRLKLVRTFYQHDQASQGLNHSHIGSILFVSSEGVDIVCGDLKVIRLVKVQPESKTAVSAIQWAQNQKLNVGDKLIE